jgi:hypothetical protein
VMSNCSWTRHCPIPQKKLRKGTELRRSVITQKLGVQRFDRLTIDGVAFSSSGWPEFQKPHKFVAISEVTSRDQGPCRPQLFTG